MTAQTPELALFLEIRAEVMRLGGAIAHDDDERMEAYLNRLGDLLDITGDDMAAFDAHYHEPVVMQ